MVSQRSEFAWIPGAGCPAADADTRLYSDPSEAHAELTEALNARPRNTNG